MLLTEFQSGKKIVVIFSGGFHPFMPHHASVYSWLKKSFPSADIYCAATNSTEERPFDFQQKQWLATQSGVPKNMFVQVKSPYRANEITSKYDANNTILVFAVSSKDKDRFSGKETKKDGTPGYFQPWPTNGSAEPMSKHGYYVIAPAVSYKVLGHAIDSASQFRKWYASSDDATRLKLAQALYPRSKHVRSIKEILDNVLGKTVTESINGQENIEYPSYVSDGKLQRIIMKLDINSQDNDDDDLYDRMDGDFYKLITIPLSKLHRAMQELDYSDDEFEYSKLTTDFPPIVLRKKGDILDGYHRAWAAKLRGDSEIRAYIPCSRKEAYEHIPTKILKCPSCQGEKVTCFNCGNSGTITLLDESKLPCLYCNGKGYTRRETKKVNPKGKEYSDYAVANCARCNGSGRIISDGPDFKKRAANDITESKNSKELKSKLDDLKPELLTHVQSLYDDWEESDDIGLCSGLADAIRACIDKHIPDSMTTIVDRDFRHFWVRVYNVDECYDIDIPFGIYEKYNYDTEEYEKIPDVIFNDDDLLIYKTTRNSLKAPWEVRKAYKPSSEDRYFMKESVDEQQIQQPTESNLTDPNALMVFLKLHCSDIIDVYTQTQKVMYSGMKNVKPNVYIEKTPSNRIPRDAPINNQIAVDGKLKSAGFTALRNNSIFCSSKKTDAQHYTKANPSPHVIFPLNGFSFTYSSVFEDLFLNVFAPWKVKNKIMTNRTEQIFNATLEELSPSEFVERWGFHKENISGAIASKKEIYIHGEYIAVLSSSEEFKYITAQLGIKV